MLVKQTVDGAGRNGIWQRDLRRETNLTATTLNKSLKTLENRSLIKAFKPANSRSKKMYISFHLDPIEELVGGPFYINGELNDAFIDVLETLITIQLRNKRVASLEQLHETCALSVASAQPLEREHFRHLLQVMEDRGYVRCVANANAQPGDTFYRLDSTLPFAEPRTDGGIPCASCALVDRCHDNNPHVNPRICPYMTRWLEINAGRLGEEIATTQNDTRTLVTFDSEPLMRQHAAVARRDKDLSNAGQPPDGAPAAAMDADDDDGHI